MLYSNEEDVGTNKRLQDNDTHSLHLIVIFILACNSNVEKTFIICILNVYLRRKSYVLKTNVLQLQVQKGDII